MVTKKPKGLGLGLEALLGPKVSETPAADAGNPHSLALSRRQFGQTEHPAGLRAVRGAGVDHTGVGVGHQRRGFARGDVGQAQEGDVGGVQQAGAFGGVLAAVGRDAQHFDVAPLRQVLIDPQAGRAFLAIDKDVD